MQKKSNAIVLQSGGPTAVINKSLYGVCSAWSKTKTKVFGSLFGINGILEQKFVVLSEINANILKSMSDNPSAALDSSRVSLCQKNGEEKGDILRKILSIFNKFGIGYCFLIGGDDSRQNANTLYNFAEQIGFKLTIIHIPKTIDNDLTHTHHSPGFGSAARFVALAVMGIDLENRAMPGVMIDIVMGRNTGWLAASSILAKQSEKSGPHLIYVPESSFDMQKFLTDIDIAMSKFGRAHIVVAEGIGEKKAIKDYIDSIKGKEFLSELCGKDDFGHPQLSGSGILGTVLSYAVKTGLKMKRVRTNSFDYLQRSFPTFSCLDQQQAFFAGARAVDFALDDANHSMVSIGTDEFTYNDQISLVSLGRVFKKEKDGENNCIKRLPKKLIINGNQISDEFFTYIGGLAGSFPMPSFLF